MSRKRKIRLMAADYRQQIEDSKTVTSLRVVSSTIDELLRPNDKNLEKFQNRTAAHCFE